MIEFLSCGEKAILSTDFHFSEVEKLRPQKCQPQPRGTDLGDSPSRIMHQETGLGHHEISMPQWISKTRNPLPFLYTHSLVISFNELNFSFVYITMRKLTGGSEKRKGAWRPSLKINFMALCTHPLKVTDIYYVLGPVIELGHLMTQMAATPLMQFPIPIEEADDKQLVRL